MNKSDLDPFRVMVALIAEQRNSDLLVELATATGLRFDTALSQQAGVSHKTRVRELIPRILAAHDSLDEPAALGAANALVAALKAYDQIFTKAAAALRRVGWDIHDSQLVVADPDLREMFFPKGSQWDAFVVLRDLFAKASTELAIVDPYCDKTAFPLLASRQGKPLAVRILCCQYAEVVATEAKAFVAQFPGWTIRVRQAKDFHDRFLVIDGTSCFHIGASINTAGKTAFMVSKLEDQASRNALLRQIDDSWSAAREIV
jgi:hypothetical protein